MQKELEQRLAAGPYRSIDELLRFALRALDSAQDIAQDLLERELLEGLEGKDVDRSRDGAVSGPLTPRQYTEQPKLRPYR